MKGRIPLKKLAVLLLALLFFPAAPAMAREEGLFHAGWEQAAGLPGDPAELAVWYDGTPDAVGAFFISVEFDPQVFEDARLRRGRALSGAYVSTQLEEDEALAACAVKGEEVLGPGQVFSCSLRVREDAPPGETKVAVSVWDVADPQSAPLEDAGIKESLSYTIREAPGTDASLRALVPAQGVLQPAFSPDCFDYALSVPYEVTAMTFSAETAPGASCRVNRKNLGAGGSESLFRLTVTAEDGKTQSEYRVTVRREEKASAAPSPSPSREPKKPTPTPIPVPTPAPTLPGEDSAEQAAGSVSRSNPAPERTPTPVPEPTEEAALSQASSSAGSSSQAGSAPLPEERDAPGVTIENGSGSLLPGFAAVLLFLGAVFLSYPLSKQVAAWFGKRKK